MGLLCLVCMLTDNPTRKITTCAVPIYARPVHSVALKYIITLGLCRSNSNNPCHDLLGLGMNNFCNLFSDGEQC